LLPVVPAIANALPAPLTKSDFSADSARASPFGNDSGPQSVAPRFLS
jgi:hypothetical protein